MPLKTALRKTRLRPIAASRPGGQTAKISHSSTTIARMAISAHAGWRSMNLLTRGLRPRRLVGHLAMPQCPPPALPLARTLPRRDRLRGRVRDILAGAAGTDLIESIFYRLGAALLRAATPWRHGDNRSAPSRHWRRKSG